MKLAMFCNCSKSLFITAPRLQKLLRFDTSLSRNFSQSNSIFSSSKTLSIAIPTIDNSFNIGNSITNITQTYLITKNLVVKHSCFSKNVNLRNFHTSSQRNGLDEFFDEQENWELFKVQVGRPWAKADLRTRSNQDLHKLWYVLLKEMNLLLTMKAEYDRLHASFPSPERLEKVEVSMDNLRQVVDERNSALSLLETGEQPHPRWIDDVDELDRPIRRLEEEHLVPREHNKEFLKKYDNLGDWTRPYKMLWNEKQRKRSFTKRKKAKHLYRKLLEKYPHLEEDPEFLREYCEQKMGGIDSNPDVEKLISEEKANEEIL